MNYFDLQTRQCTPRFGTRCKKYLLATGLALALGHACAKEAAVSAPFIIAPMIEGLGYCAAGVKSASIPAAMAVCASSKNPSGPLIQAALNRLEPGGAAGKVQVGYTVGINLLGFEQQRGLSAHLARLQQLIETTRRPVVLYLMGNQFAATPAQISLPASSYAAFADQSVPKEHYFVSSIQAWTLEMDPALEVNRVRFGALQELGRWYVTLPEQVKNRIVGITLAGELHHFFPDFANGMGRFEDIKVTDYSPGSVRSFRAWLRSRYPNLKELNQKMGTAFASFDAISPPARNIRREKLDSFSQHFDAYAHGLLPIEGWLAALPPKHTIHIYLDGKDLGEAEYGLSRQDVYEALAEVKDARVGFRYWLDFSTLPRGIHTVQVAVISGAQRWQIAQRKIVLMGGSQEAPPAFVGLAALNTAPPKLRYWLDQPRNMQDYYFNPLAKAWSGFRSYQVTNAYRQWFDRAVAGGLPKDKLYSHQIGVATVGTWNPMLTASDESLSGAQPYKKGINLYGGALDVDLLRRHYLGPNEAFAVPEFHTQAWKNPKAPARVLQSFRAAGASFVSPYFISILPDSLRAKDNPHDKFRIAPDNSSYGSNHLYDAIGAVARE